MNDPQKPKRNGLLTRAELHERRLARLQAGLDILRPLANGSFVVMFVFVGITVVLGATDVIDATSAAVVFVPALVTLVLIGSVLGILALSSLQMIEKLIYRLEEGDDDAKAKVKRKDKSV
ncbi:MAG: hypothetical protein AAF125_24900 [Chloroflexota bacterium]